MWDARRERGNAEKISCFCDRRTCEGDAEADLRAAFPTSRKIASEVACVHRAAGLTVRYLR